MAAGSFQFTVGSGTYQHTFSYTRGAVTGHAPYVGIAEYQEATYDIDAVGISVATSADHIMQVMAGASLNVAVRRIYVEQSGLATTAANLTIQVLRLTTAGTGG